MDKPKLQQHGLPMPLAAGFGAVRMPVEVLAKVAEEFAVGLTTVRRALGTSSSGLPPRQQTCDAALVEIDRLEQLGIQIQELCRVLDGKGVSTPERLDLAAAARTVLLEHGHAMRESAAPSAEAPFLLDMNAAALSQLLDLAIECALQAGTDLEIGTSHQGSPPHALMSLHVDRPASAADGRDDRAIHAVPWLLLTELGRALGLVVGQTVTDRAMTLTLGFPGPSASADDSTTAASLPRSRSARGRNALLIEPRELPRVAAHRLMREAGMRVDSVADVDTARACIERNLPDIVVTGLPVDAQRCRAFLDELRVLQPGLRVVELVDDDDAFEFGAPGFDSPARVARTQLARNLLRAVTQELDSA